jgi:hypothetical protein
VWLLIALAAIRLLPRALRREARALELITLLFQVAASAATANTAMSYTTAQRVGALETRAGTTEANVTAVTATANAALPAAGGTVSGDVHISGSLYGSGGTLTVGDNVDIQQALTVANTVTTHSDFRGATTTGDGGQGSILGDEFTAGIPGGGAFTLAANTWLLDWQAAFNAHVSDTQATVNRVNDILTAIG